MYISSEANLSFDVLRLKRPSEFGFVHKEIVFGSWDEGTQHRTKSIRITPPEVVSSY